MGITFTEEDGIDYAPTTVQLPGGERVPFLFTIKELVAKGSGGAFKPGYEFGGSFKVPSYRTGLFLDPKGRGMTTGYARPRLWRRRRRASTARPSSRTRSTRS